MRLLNLKFTSKAVAEFEEKKGSTPLLSILLDATITVKTLAEFVMLGRVGCDEDTAYSIIDEALANEGVDTSDLMEEIIDTFEKNGFFSKAKVKKAIEEQIAMEKEKKQA